MSGLSFVYNLNGYRLVYIYVSFLMRLNKTKWKRFPVTSSYDSLNSNILFKTNSFHWVFKTVYPMSFFRKIFGGSFYNRISIQYSISYEIEQLSQSVHFEFLPRDKTVRLTEIAVRFIFSWILSIRLFWRTKTMWHLWELVIASRSNHIRFGIVV